MSTLSILTTFVHFSRNGYCSSIIRFTFLIHYFSALEHEWLDGFFVAFHQSVTLYPLQIVRHIQTLYLSFLQQLLFFPEMHAKFLKKIFSLVTIAMLCRSILFQEKNWRVLQLSIEMYLCISVEISLSFFRQISSRESFWGTDQKQESVFFQKKRVAEK